MSDRRFMANVKNLDPVCKVCVWVIGNCVFCLAIGPETFTFIDKQLLSLNVIDDINVFASG
ncbi:hypothetical protein [Microcoleus sp. LEGE 07076]|uniref:hypothetical protein n=2 Tax=Microcoleus sp. LEGE 07076 TaxID=915322 RepID=UPI0018825299|nr:hypothetical protein [Microcoleus sp. LEGE 07076]